MSRIQFTPCEVGFMLDAAVHQLGRSEAFSDIADRLGLHHAAVREAYLNKRPAALRKLYPYFGLDSAGLMQLS